MDEIYVTYVDDEHVDNHDYDDNTDDDHDNNNDLYARACNARVNTSIKIFRKMKNHQNSSTDSPDDFEKSILNYINT